MKNRLITVVQVVETSKTSTLVNYSLKREKKEKRELSDHKFGPGLVAIMVTTTAAIA